jgi:hypothetical protein
MLNWYPTSTVIFIAVLWGLWAFAAQVAMVAMARDRRKSRDAILGACKGVPSSWSPQLTHRTFRSHFHDSFPSPSPDIVLFIFVTPADLPDASPQSISGHIHRLHSHASGQQPQLLPGPLPFAHSKPQSHDSHYDYSSMRWNASMGIRQATPGWGSVSWSSSPINRDDAYFESRGVFFFISFTSFTTIP